MPTASTGFAQSRDGRFLFAIGTYKPRVRCYELGELSLKFERYLDCEGLSISKATRKRRKKSRVAKEAGHL